MPRITPGSMLKIFALIGFISLFFSGGDGFAGLVFSFVIWGASIIFLTILVTKRYKFTENLVFDIANQPVLETNEATESVSFAAEGTLVSGSVVHSHILNIPCVYYHSVLQERVGFGKNRHWKIVYNLVDTVPIYVQDKRGRVEVDLRNVDQDHSELHIKHRNKERKDYRYSEIDTEIVINKMEFIKEKKKYRKSEYVLKPNIPVFVYGYIEKGEKGGLLLREHENHPLVVSRKSHQDFIAEFAKGENFIYFAHLFVFVGFLFIVMSPALWEILPLRTHLFVASIGGVIILGSVVFTMYNRLVYLRNRLLNAWSNIDGELKRRHDLIDQLISCVSGYVKHEKEVQTIIALLRGASQEDQGAINTHTRMAAQAEAYPDLQASHTFHRLMTELSDTEERIAYSRGFYNGTVKKYNTKIEQAPFNLLAKIFTFHRYDFFTLGPERPMAELAKA